MTRFIKLTPLVISLLFVAACSSSSNDGEPNVNNDTVNAVDNDNTGESESDTTNGVTEIDASNVETDNSDQTIADVTDSSELNNEENLSPINSIEQTEDEAQQVALTSATTLPFLSEDGTVSWGFDPQPSDLEVQIQDYVELPLASNGEPARWNSMSSFDNRVFIVDEQDGHVYEITNRQSTLWFDIAESIQTTTGRTLDISNSFHGGVRGIAFHPDFLSNGKFYASVMEERPTDTTTHVYLSDGSGINADSVLVEWTADTTTFAIDSSSYREVFRVGVPEFDHPIKQIAFNTNLSTDDADYANLYIAHGDGSVASTLAGSGHNNDALGKILRINPLQNANQPFSVPANNPFVSDDSIPNEVFSYGHRNPHHLAFTSEGHLLATEAGRDNIDEINVIARGADYGWAEREGAFVHLDEGTLVNGVSALSENDAINGYVYPAAQFGHHGSTGATFTGEALGGGYVVENGSEIDGEFFYIDFPKTGLLMHSSLTDLLAATTTGSPADLTNAQTYSASIKYDHDANPDTPALDTTLRDIVVSAQGYVNTFDRVDVRILQGPQGELYLASKRNNMVYLITNSL